MDKQTKNFRLDYTCCNRISRVGREICSVGDVTNDINGILVLVYASAIVIVIGSNASAPIEQSVSIQADYTNVLTAGVHI